MINVHQILSFIPHFFLANRNGHGVHSPFGYQLCEEVFYNNNSFYDFESLKQVRNELLINNEQIEVTDFGAGSKTFSGNKRKIKAIADRGVSTTQQSELFYKLIHFLNCNHIVELGTSVGLNTLYMANANKQAQVFTLEGSKNLSEFAKTLAQKNKISNIQFIHATFDEALPNLIHSLPALDLLYVDGNHRYEATLNYFKLALQKTHNNSVIIFDDIYWSKGMTKAWQEIKNHPSVTLSIDAFYFGMIFFKSELKEKTHLRFYI